jgi:hypothetical protein
VPTSNDPVPDELTVIDRSCQPDVLSHARPVPRPLDEEVTTSPWVRAEPPRAPVPRPQPPTVDARFGAVTHPTTRARLPQRAIQTHILTPRQPSQRPSFLRSSRRWLLLLAVVPAVTFLVTLLLFVLLGAAETTGATSIAPMELEPPAPAAKVATRRPEPAPVEPERVTPQPVESSPERTLEARAADRLIRGHHREAIVLYEQLADENPTNATFAEIARILHRRVDAADR